MTLGQKIIAQREALGWTQNRLAKEAGLNQPTLQKIEAGTRNPSFQIAIKIAKALNVSINDLASDALRELDEQSDQALSALISTNLAAEIADLRKRVEKLEQQ